ncbi:hypothetical protein V8E52_010978 [Russula decolorans]
MDILIDNFNMKFVAFVCLIGCSSLKDSKTPWKHVARAIEKLDNEEIRSHFIKELEALYQKHKFGSEEFCLELADLVCNLLVTLTIPKHGRNVSGASRIPPPREGPSSITVLFNVLLSDEGKYVTAKEDLREKVRRMKRKGQEARNLAKQGRSKGTVDLHGLYVNEALKYTKLEFQSVVLKSDKVARFIIVVYDGSPMNLGKGLHAKNGKAKIRPALEKLCKDVDHDEKSLIIISLQRMNKRGISGCIPRAPKATDRNSPCLRINGHISAFERMRQVIRKIECEERRVAPREGKPLKTSTSRRGCLMRILLLSVREKYPGEASPRVKFDSIVAPRHKEWDTISIVHSQALTSCKVRREELSIFIGKYDPC